MVKICFITYKYIPYYVNISQTLQCENKISINYFMKNKAKITYIILGLCTQYDFNRLGKIVIYHEFKRLVEVNSLDSVVSFCLSAPYTRFRVVRRANKKFLTTLNCYKLGNSLIFG